MKTLSQFFQHLIREPTKKQPERPQPDPPAALQPFRDPQKNENRSFANDNSPPGYKIRWRH
jgi:hypothetical protein